MNRLAAFWLLAAVACGDDPVRAAAIAALGAEDPAVPVGPLHRPGQPCVLCHRAGGEAEAYSVAGTVYRDRKSAVPAPNVRVMLVDAALQKHEAVTNCAGNFFVAPAELTPRFPLWVTLRRQEDEIEMESPIYAEGSCAACHTDPPSPSSAGRIFLLEEATDVRPEPCVER